MNYIKIPNRAIHRPNKMCDIQCQSNDICVEQNNNKQQKKRTSKEIKKERKKEI